MLFDVGNIITLVISVLLIIVFRQLDRNNRSLEKVKKYSDKVKNELDDYLKSREQSLQDASVELDVKQTQAIASVKRLDQMKEGFAAGARSLQEHTDQVAGIEQKIASYDEALKNLSIMTSQAEENLKRLTAESEFADRLNKKLREAKDQLAHIEDSVPALRAKFDEDNSAHLGALENSIMEKMGGRLNEINAAIQKTGETSRGLLASVQDTLDKAFTSAAKKADTLEDTAFEKLHAKALERLQKYQSSYEEKNVRLQELVKEKVTEAQQLAKTFKTQWHEESSEYLEAVRAEIQELKTAHGGTAARLEEDFSSVSRTVETRSQEIAAQMHRLESEVSSKTEELSGLVETLEVKYTSSAERLDSDVRKLDAELRSRLKEDFAAFSGSCTGTLENLSSEVAEKTEALQTELEERSNALRAGFGGRSSELLSDLEEKDSAFRANLAERNAAFKSELESQNTAFRSVFEEKTAALQSGLDTKTSALRADLEDRSASLRADLEDRSASLRADFEEQNTSMRADLEEQSTSLRADLEEQSTSLRAELETVSTSLSAGFDSGSAGLEENIRNTFERLSDVLREKTETIESGTEDTFNRLSAVLKEKSGALHTENSKTLEALAAELREKARAAAEQNEKSLLHIHEELSARTAGLEQNSESLCSRLSSELEEKTAHISKETENTYNRLISEVQSRSGEVEARLGSVFDKLNSEIDRNRNTLLENFQSRFDIYEKDILYRFDRLDKVSVDVDLLEEQLRRAMDETRKRVTGEFELFTRGQQEKQNHFEEGQLQKEDVLAQRMQNLENDLNELKTKAYSNVSEKLKVFEDDFFADLSKRTDSLNTVLSQWKASVDERLSGLSAECEADRREQELKSAEVLKEQLAAVNEKYREQTGRLEQQITAAEEALRSRIAAGDQALRDFVEEYRVEFTEARKASEDYLKNELTSYSSAVQEQLRKQEREITMQTREMADGAAAAKNETSAALDSIRSEFTQWKNRIDQQFAEAKDFLSEKLTALEAASFGAIEHVASSFTADVENYSARTEEEYGRIKGILTDLRADMQTASDNFDTRSSGAVDEFRKSYETMMEETQRRIRESNSEADQKLRALKALAQETAEKNADMQNRMVQKIQNDSMSLNLTLDEIDKRLKNFMSQTRLFDRADEMKEQLESQLADLRGEIARVEGFRQMLNEVEQQFSKIKRLEDDLSQKMIRFTGEKKRLEILESDFSRLMSLSNSMDKKISEMNTTHDDLQVLEVEVRRFQDTLADISGRYDRLEKKNDILDKTITGVDKAFDSLKIVEKEMQNCAEQVSAFPDQIIDLKRGVEKLLDNGDKINMAVDKLTSLDKILEETEKRTENMQTAREWLARTETRLQEISKQAQEQVKLMGDLLKDDGGIKKDRGAPPISVRETVTKLAHQGWKIDEIARATKLSRGEVELILELSQGGA